MAAVNHSVRLVAVDDESASLELVEDALTQPGLEIFTCSAGAQGWELIRRVHPEIVLLDLMMPDVSGMELLERIVQWDPSIDVILLTGRYSTESAVEAIQKGASDYLNKPVSPKLLREKIEKLLSDARRRRRTVQLEDELLETCRFGGMVGRSPAMLELFARIRRVAPHFKTALITGPTGAGKELAARALHDLSRGAAARFGVCNCSAIVENLFESELFGHLKGSFTGAIQDRAGLFEYANGGTVLLDEIGDMPLATQSKLLRVLQNYEIQRVGSSTVRTVDVRVIAATNRDLRQMIAQKQFREDLYYRLSMMEIKLPRLSERREDLPLLARHFVEAFSAQYGRSIRRIAPRAQALLYRHSWPGNVRELENVIGHACMMAAGEVIDVRDLPEYMQKRDTAVDAAEDVLPLADMERRYVRRVLEQMGGNKVQTARVLGISRATLYALLETEVPE